MSTGCWIALAVVTVLILVGASGKKKPKRRASTRRSTRPAAPDPRPSKPKRGLEKAVPTVIANYDRLTEAEIGQVEFELLPFPKLEYERSLLYALRVSRCVPTLKTLTTLGARWTTANAGAAGFGLQYGRSSPHWQQTFEFLTHLYLSRFDELVGEVVAKATDTASQRKTAAAKRNVWRRAYAKVHEALISFHYTLPGIEEAAGTWIKHIEDSERAVDKAGR